jgi:hypothetical protein
MNWLERAISALAYTLAEEAASPEEPRLAAPYNDVARYVGAALGSCPDYLRGPLVLATLGFDLAGLLHGGALFHRQRPERRLKQVRSWRSSPVSACRDLIRFHQNLAVFALYGRLEPEA